MRNLVDRIWRWGLRAAWIGARVWFYVASPAIRASGILVIWEDRVLLLEHSYKKESGLPGGMLKRAEDPAMGAVRELREEIGVQVQPSELEHRGTFFQKLSRATVELHLFEWRPETEPQILIDRREIIAATYETRESLLRKLPGMKETLQRLALPDLR